jgi:hypothetical protein
MVGDVIRIPGKTPHERYKVIERGVAIRENSRPSDEPPPQYMFVAVEPIIE